MFFIFISLMGVISFQKLEISLLPNLEFPRLTIITLFPNAAPKEVEKLVTKPISESIGTVSGIEKITSESYEGISFVMLQFTWDTKIDFAAMDVREKLDLIKSVLPEEARKSVVSKFDPSQNSIIEIVATTDLHPGKGLSKKKDLRYFLKNEVKGFLDKIDGVALVQFSGGHQKEIQIEVDGKLLGAYGLSLSEIKNSLKTSNLNFPAGSIEVGTKNILIRTFGEYKQLSDINKTIVGTNQAGVPIPLHVLANVKDTYKDRKGLAKHNGKECVVISIYKEAGKNTANVAENIRNELEKVKQLFHKEVTFGIVYDESRFVKQSIRNISRELFMGASLAFISLIVILRNFQSPFIILTILPVSIFTTFLFLFLKKISLNMMSLGGLSLGIGMLFDSGNVILASIERHIKLGKEPKMAALEGAAEVSGSITAAVLTTTIVFLPIIFLKGVVGIVFEEMAFSITISLLVSLFVALTLIPVLSSLRRERRQHKERGLFRKFHYFELVLQKRYTQFLKIILKYSKTFISIIFLLFLVSLLFLGFVKKEFIPKVDTGEFTIDFENAKGASLASTTEAVQYIEASLLQHRDIIKHTISFIGYDEEQLFNRKGGDIGTHKARIKVILKTDRDILTKDFIEMIRKKIIFRDEVSVTYTAEGNILANLLSPGARSISLDIKGSDIATLSLLGKEISALLAKINGVTDVKSTMGEKAKEYHIYFDEDKISHYNLNHEIISSHLKTAIKGSQATKLRIGDEEINILLRLQAGERERISDIQKMLLKTPTGENIYLAELIQIKQKQGYSSIIRSGHNRINRVTAGIQEGGEKNDIYDKLDRLVQNAKLPRGFSLVYSGEKEEIDKSLTELSYSFLLAVILIYMVLASKFEELRFPFLMLTTIPLIAIGIIPTLIFTNKSLNISSFIGIILLLGIVVDNAALFYEYMEIFEEEGYSAYRSILKSGKVVLRPILMNNGTTLLGLLPVALEIGEGTEFQSPMAIAVISGLFTSVFISLFLIPAIFYLLSKKSKQHA